jgi:hypothetical protein
MKQFSKYGVIRTFILTAAASLAIGGCVTMPESEADASPRLRVNISLERQTSERPTLKALYLTLQSSSGKTIRDTITDHGGKLSGPSVLLNPPKTHGQILTPRYNLSPAGQWTIKIQSIDQNDSVIHDHHGEVGPMDAGQIRDLSLRLGARVANYEGHFIPRSTTPDGRSVRVVRYELDVDGRTLCSGELAKNASQSLVKIGCEYLPTGSNHVTTRIFGTVGDDTGSRLLWEGSTRMEINASNGATVPLELKWNDDVHPLSKSVAINTSAEMNTEIRLGRVGHVVMAVTMSAEIAL